MSKCLAGRGIRFFAVAVLASGFASANAATPSPQPLATVAAVEDGTPVSKRIPDFVAMINGELAPAAVLAPQFLAKVPAERISQRWAGMRAQFGQATGASDVDVRDDTAATFTLHLERKTLQVEMGVEPAAPHLVHFVRISE